MSDSKQRVKAVKSAQRMSGFDFATWRSSANDPVMRSTILGLVVLDSSPDWGRVLDRFDRAARTATLLRTKVVDPGGLFQNPRLIIDPDFDLNFHVRRYMMPEGSNWSDVLEEARRQSLTDFNMDRPLWQMTLLEGLPGGKAVAIIKLHHAVADGQGAMILSASLFDFQDGEIDLGPLPPEPEGADLDRFGFAEAMVRDNFGWVAKNAPEFVKGIAPATLKAITNPIDTINKVRTTTGSLAKTLNIPLGPLSPLMTQRSTSYHFTTIDFPFEYLKNAAKAEGTTANDAFLAAVGEGMAIYHEKFDTPVSQLRINMPVSLRVEGDGLSNAVTIARFEMPIHVGDPADLMHSVDDIVRKLRREPGLKMIDQIGEASRLVPQELLSAVAQASDVTASNVAGSPVPMWFAGSKVLRMYPLVGTVGAAVNITMLTYNGNASVGISTDDAAVDDLRVLMQSLRQGFSNVLGISVHNEDPIARSGSAVVARATRPETKTEAPAKKASTKKAAKKAPVKKAPVKKVPAKKKAAKKAPAKRAAKKSPAKKATAKKATNRTQKK